MNKPLGIRMMKKLSIINYQLSILLLLTACHTTKETSQKDGSVQDTQMQTTTLTSIVSSDSVLRNIALELDSFDLIVVTAPRLPLQEKAILPGDTIAHLSPTLRYRLRAKHATLRNNALSVSVKNTDAVATTDSTAHQNTQRETATAQETTATYKPPDANFIIIVLLATAAIFLIIRYKLKR